MTDKQREFKEAKRKHFLRRAEQKRREAEKQSEIAKRFHRRWAGEYNQMTKTDVKEPTNTEKLTKTSKVTTSTELTQTLVRTAEMTLNVHTASEMTPNVMTVNKLISTERTSPEMTSIVTAPISINPTLMTIIIPTTEISKNQPFLNTEPNDMTKPNKDTRPDENEGRNNQTPEKIRMTPKVRINMLGRRYRRTAEFKQRTQYRYAKVELASDIISFQPIQRKDLHAKL